MKHIMLFLGDSFGADRPVAANVMEPDRLRMLGDLYRDKNIAQHTVVDELLEHVMHLYAELEEAHETISALEQDIQELEREDY